MDENNRKHWIIRVGDGINFKNSVYPYWGLKRGSNGIIKSIVKTFNKGDILWFLTSKNYGGKFIGMAEYINFYDRDDEPLLSINTKTNEEQNWNGDDNWNIQILYKNLYNTEKQNLKECIRGASSILHYERNKNKMNNNLELHYQNYIFYTEPYKFIVND